MLAQVHHFTFRAHRGVDLAQATQHAMRLELAVQHVVLQHAVHDGQHRRIGADRGANGIDGAGQVICLATEHDHVIRALQGLFSDQLRLQRDITQRALDAQPLFTQTRRARLAHQKGHIRASLRRASTKISTGAASTQEQQPHSSLL
ncbi:hypothetical protein D3C71_1373320 [compost metagenome]